MTLTILYTDEDFFFTTRRDEKSLMDNELQKIWKTKVKEGWFRYQLGDLQTKCLPGKYGLIVQLNQDRAIKRRESQFVSDVVMEFDPNQFHFGKVHEKEVIFNIEPKHWSPLGVLKKDEFRLAIEIMLKSQDSSFRIGFNSLGGYASVNHLHFHAYYLKYELFLEHAPTKQLKHCCYVLIDFPSEGFVFEILENKDIKKITRAVATLTKFLVHHNIAHNVFLTRGTPLSKPTINSSELSAVRIYVWAREAHYGIKDGSSFNVAVCELAGHIPIKDQEFFLNITEDVVAGHLYAACHDTYVAFKPKVKTLFRKFS